MSNSSQRLNKSYGSNVTWAVGGGFENYEDGLWIYMTPITFNRDNQSVLSRRGNSIKGSTTISKDSFTFLAPVSITFALRHIYEKYDSIASRAADVYSKWMRVNAEGLGAGSNFLSNFQSGGIGNAISQLVSNASKAWENRDTVAGQRALGQGIMNTLDSGNVAYTRVDAPLIYKDSDNMRYAFEFELAAYRDPEKEIVSPINKLLEYSCPEPDDDLASIHPPSVWKLEAKSKKGGAPLFRCNFAALVNVNPTYHQPYIMGQPSKANLVVEFVDIEPVYKTTTFSNNYGKVTTSSSGKNPVRNFM